MNLVSMIDSSVGKFPGKPMIVSADRTWSYAEAAQASRQAAGWLQEQGVGAGDTIAIMSLNVPEFIIAMIGAWRLGAVVVPVNHKLADPEALYVVRHSKAKLALVSDEIIPTLAETARHTRVVPLVGNPEDGLIATVLRSAPYETDGKIDESTPAEILYTSGTTGKPKGCVHTHRGVCNTALLSAVTFSMTPADRVLIAMPIWHASPLNNFAIPSLAVGATVVLLPQYHPEHFIRTLEAQRITMYFGAPVSYVMPLKVFPSLADFDFSSIRALYYGGGPISPELARQLVKAYGTDRFYQVFGMTETGPTGVMFPPEDLEAKAGSIGRAAMPTVDIRVVMEDGSPAGPGEIGEIWIRSDSVMRGYLDNPDATREAMSGDWYRSGDLARVDEDGFLFIVDRLKDAIVTGGENVYCNEVEDVLAGHPAIADCAVIGLPHPEWGETVAVAVVLNAGAEIDLKSLSQDLSGKIAAYKTPRRLMVTDALPRTPTGKVMKHVLRDSFVDHEALQKVQPS
jgi:feruloyl-CoA synthase